MIKMGFGIKSVISDGFNLITKNKILFLPLFISLVLSSILSIPYYIRYPSLYSGTYDSSLPPFTLDYYVVVIFAALFAWFAHLWTVHLAYSATKRKISLKKSANVALRSILNFIGAGILYVFIVMVGMIAFIIPGIYLAVRLLYFPYSIVINGEGVFGSLKKSWGVSRGKWWFTFGVGFVLTVISALLVLPIYGLFFFAYKNFIITTVLVSIVSIFFTAWSLVSYSIAYLKLRK